jgi:hypothetical protein
VTKDNVPHDKAVVYCPSGVQYAGGIAKAFGLDDGPTHRKAAIVKGQALGDATRRML